MKYLLISILIAFSYSLIAQKTTTDKQLSKHELGLNFKSYGQNFNPELNYRYYKTEQRIRSLSFGGHYNDLGYSYSIGLWNERRKYLTKNNRLFLSRGLNGSIGYSSYDYSQFNRSDLTWNAAVVSIGYKIGIGYKMNNRLSVISTINPKVNHFFLDQKSSILNKNYRFSAPLNIGFNYRF